MSYPLKKCDFFGLWKMLFFKVKKNSFSFAKSESIICSVILIKSKQRKNGSFGKADFLDFEKFCSLSPNKVFLSLQSQKALFLGLVWSNLNKEKIGIFWTKTWVWKKCEFLDFEKFSFYSQRFFFPLLTKKALFLVLFDQI